MSFIANTNLSTTENYYALMESGLSKYFDICLYTNGIQLCRKPCNCLFEVIYQFYKTKYANIKKNIYEIQKIQKIFSNFIDLKTK